jgi:DNA-binding response OmpR family regulator
MRVLVVSEDVEAREWLAAVLGGAGMTVDVLGSIDPASPELRVAELAVLDHQSAERLGPEPAVKRVLLAPRGATVDIDAVRGGFSEILVVPSEPEDVVARVRRAASSRPERA